MQGVQIRQRKLCGIVAGAVFCAQLAFCAPTIPTTSVVMLEWDPSPDSRVVGYAIWYGNQSGVYHTRVDVGNNTSVTLSNLTIGLTYYFVATAYAADGTESLPSNEVEYTVPGLLSVTHATVQRIAMLQFNGYPGETLAVQASEDLKNWTMLYQLQPTVNQLIQIVDPASAYLPMRFYRLVGPNVGTRKIQLTQLSATALPKLTFAANPGQIVEIQVSDDRANWVTLERFVVTSTQPLEIYDPTITDIPMRFYRTAVSGIPANEVVYLGPDAIKCTILADKEISMLSFWGQPDEVVTVQASDDMVNWSTLYQLHIQTNKLIQLADPYSAGAQQRFYRLAGSTVAGRQIHLVQLRPKAIAKVSFVAPPGDVVQLQASENLVEWKTLYQIKIQTNQWIEVIDPESPSLPHRFYRIAPTQ